MGRGTKIWLIVAICLIVTGCILFGVAMRMLKWDFEKLSTTEFVTNEYAITEGFSDISVTADTADISFVVSADGQRKVVCREQVNATHTVAVKDGALVIELVDRRAWHEYIGINLKAPSITVYLPQGEFGALTVRSSTGFVKLPQQLRFESMVITLSTGHLTCLSSTNGAMNLAASTGDITVQNVSAKSVNLCVSTGAVRAEGITCTDAMTVNVSTGRARLKDVQCSSFSSIGNTGDLFMENVVAAGDFSLRRTTGNVEFTRCDAANICIKTSTGWVKGDLKSAKVFITRSDTGSVDVPKTVTGGRCEITTSTGDIKVTVS